MNRFYSRVGRGGAWLAVAALLFTLVGLSGPLTAQARPSQVGASIVVAPTTAVPGQRLTITGSGLKPGEMITLYWDNLRLSGSDEVSSTGSLVGAYAYAPMSTTTGRHVLTFAGQTSGRIAIVPIMVPSPALHWVSLTAGPGELFPIRGTGFGVGEAISFSWDGVVLPTWHAKATAEGNFGYGGAFGHVPQNAAAGEHILLARGLTTGRTAQVRIMVLGAALHGVPLNVTPGELFPLQGTGFGANEMITFTWDGAVLPDWHATTTAQGTFGFNGAFGHVPQNTALGQHILLARGLVSGRTAQVRVMVVTPALHWVSLTASPGELFSIRGTGFGAGEAITFTWDGKVLPDWHATATAQGNFGYGGAFGHVPYNAAPGMHILLARGLTTGRTAQVQIMVPSAALRGVPLNLTPGERFPIQGTGFGAGEAITFTWDGKVLPDWHATATAQGNFGFGGAFGHVPRNAAPGQHVLLARGQRTGLTAQVRIMVMAA